MHYFNPLWCPFLRSAPPRVPCGTPQLPGAPGRHGAGGVHSLALPFSTPGIAKPGFRALCDSGSPVRLWKPCACQGSLPLAWPLLPPLSLSAGTRSPGLALERPFGTGGALGLGDSPTPGLRAHGTSSAVGLPCPPQRPMLDVGFSFLVPSRGGQGFLSLCFPTGWSAWGRPRTELFCSLSLAREVPGRLTFARLPHFMLYNCLVSLLLGLRLLSHPVPPYPQTSIFAKSQGPWASR